MTTYDDIWSRFISNTKTDDINLPNASQKIYDAIHSAVDHFNNRKRDNLGYDDTSETVNRDLTTDELIQLAHFIRLSFLENQLISFTTTWSPFSKEVGIKNLSFQIKALENLIENEKKTIDSLISNTEEDIW